MSFAGPIALVGGGVAIAGALLTLLYLLTLERRRVVVPFAALWTRALAGRSGVRLGARLRRPLSLLVQLCLLALLALALADPRREAAAGGGRAIVILVDTSASMQATDARPFVNRLDFARDRARAIADSMSAADRATVVRLDGQPLALGGLTADERELARRIDALAPGDAPADLAGGLALAADLVRGHARPTIVLISDGAFPPDAIARLHTTSAPGPAGVDLRGVDLRFARVGTVGNDDNLAIVGFAARRHPHDPARFAALVRVVSLRATPATVQLELRQDGVLVHVETLALPPHGELTRALDDLAGTGTRLEARLVAPGGGSQALDALALDDRAFATLVPRHRQRLLLVTSGNLFLEGALLLDAGVEVDTIAPAAYTPELAARHDLLILDGLTPPAAPVRPTLFIDPRGPSSPFTIVRDEPRVLVTQAAAQHPIMRWVTLADLNVARASVFALAPGDVALASSIGAPIFVAREGARRQIALGFDVRRSDLPLRVAFPVLLMNALEWLARADDLGEDAPLRTGAIARIAVEGGAAVTMTGPDGSVQRPPIVDGVAHAYLGRAGFHALTIDKTTRTLAASLSDIEESRIAARDTLIVDGTSVPPPLVARRPPWSLRDPWSWLVLAALALSLVEWWTWSRRVTV